MRLLPLLLGLLLILLMLLMLLIPRECRRRHVTERRIICSEAIAAGAELLLILAFLVRLVASRYQIYVKMTLDRCGKRLMGGLYGGGGAERSIYQQ